MSIYTMIEELGTWFDSLSAEFAFLLALPFIVAAAAFAGDWVRRRRSRRDRPQARLERHGRHEDGRHGRHAPL